MDRRHDVGQRRQVEQPVTLQHQRGDGVVVADIDLVKNQPRLVLQVLQVVKTAAGQVVEHHNLVSVGQ